MSHKAALARRIGIHGGYISDFLGAFEDTSEVWLKCQQQLLNIKRFAKDNELALLVVIIPFLSDLSEHHLLRREIDIVVIFCRANKIDTLNLFPYFYGHRTRELWINAIDGHPNEKAHQIMAEAISDYLLSKWSATK